MSATGALGRQWYHATTTEFGPDDIIAPASKIDGRGNFAYSADPSKAGKVYGTDNLEDAQGWARSLMHGNANSDHPVRKVNIYAATPVNPRRQPIEPGHPATEIAADHAFVGRKVASLVNGYFPPGTQLEGTGRTSQANRPALRLG